jgi:hypothetical protein
MPPRSLSTSSDQMLARAERLGHSIVRTALPPPGSQATASAPASRPPALSSAALDTIQRLKNKKKWSPAQREQSRKFWEKKEKKEERKAAAAAARERREGNYLRDRILRPDDDSLRHELPILLKGSFELDDWVTNVRLQGSTTPGVHQDLLCTLASGRYLRFSRNQGGDTAQYGAKPDLLTKIEDYEPTKKPTTIKDALEAFRAAHDAMRLYDHGDCQSFADEIVYRLTGQKTGFGSEGLDGDDAFM